MQLLAAQAWPSSATLPITKAYIDPGAPWWHACMPGTSVIGTRTHLQRTLCRLQLRLQLLHGRARLRSIVGGSIGALQQAV